MRISSRLLTLAVLTAATLSLAFTGCDDAAPGAADTGNTDATADATTDGTSGETDTDVPTDDTAVGPDSTDATLGDAAVDAPVDAPLDTTVDVAVDNGVDVDAGPVYQGPIGGDRPAAVTLPDDYSAQKSYPLVILLHGYSATGFIQNAYLQFSDKATDFGFIAVVPEGTKNGSGTQFWNATATCCDLENSGVDDEGYLLDLITEAKSHWNVDPARVYFMGHSNGGFMSYRMACNHADVVAGIVSIAGSSVHDVADCQPSQPVSVLQVHGTLDTVISYPTGLMGPGAEALIDRWVGFNNCDTAAIPDVKADYDTNVIFDETERSWYRGCDGGTEVGLWKMVASLHVPIFKDEFMPDVLTWLFTH